MKYLGAVIVFIMVITVSGFVGLVYNSDAQESICPEMICQDFQDKSLTGVQKDAIWAQKYKDKIVSWEGRVDDVRVGMTGVLRIFVSLYRNKGWDYSMLEVKPDFNERAATLKKGQIIKFTGRLSDRPMDNCDIVIEDVVLEKEIK